MNRTQLHDAIFALTDSPHMVGYTIAALLAEVTTEQAGRVFDQVADHHDLVTRHPAGKAGRVNVVAVPPGETYVPADPNEIVLDLRD